MSFTTNESEVVVNVKLLRRAEREAIQRACNIRRLKKAFKSLPKYEREQVIASARDAKYSFVREESGITDYLYGAAAVAAGAAGAAAGFSIAKTSHEIGEAVKDTLSGVNAVMQPAGAIANSVGGALEYLYSLVKQVYDTCANIVGKFSQLIFGIFVVAMKACFGLVNMASRLFDSVVSMVAPDFHLLDSLEEDDVLPQSGCMSYLPQVVTLVCTFFVPTYSTKAYMSEVMRRVGSYDRTASGISSVFTSIAMMVQDCINVVLRRFGVDEIQLIGEAEKQVLEWCRQVDDVFKIIDTSTPQIKDLQFAQSLLAVGYNFKKVTTASHLLHTIDRTLEKLNHKLVAHKGIMNDENAFRQQPILVMFGGGSGIGKTNLIKSLAGAILQLADMCKPEHVAQNLWQKGDTQYWNGYVGQLVYIMDDVFQKKEVAGGAENEGFTIIRAVSNWPFPLNFADVESKGRFYFSSKLMIGTTNVDDIQRAAGGVLQYPEAVVRRIEHGYWLELADDYKTERKTLDYAKLKRVHDERLRTLFADGNQPTKMEVLRSFPWEAFEARPHNFASGAPGRVGGFTSLLDIAVEIAEELKARSERHEAECTMTLDWLTAISRARPEAGFSSALIDPTVGVSSQASHSGEPPQTGDPPSSLRGTMERQIDDLVARRLRASTSTTPEERTAEFAAGLDGVAEMCIGDIKREQEKRRTAIEYIVYLFKTVAPSVLALLNVAMFLASGAISVWLHYKFIQGICSLVSYAFKCVLSLMEMARDFIFGTTPVEQSVHVEHKTMPRKKTQLAPPSAVIQMGNPPADNLADIAYKNSYKIMLGNGEEAKSVGQVLMLRQSFGVMPCHFLTCPEGPLRFISCAGNGHVIHSSVQALKACRVIALPTSDMVFVDLKPILVRAHRDIVKHFVTDKTWNTLKDMRNTSVRLDVARMSGDSLDRHVMYSSFLRFDPQITTIVTQVDNVWAYDCPTKVGDCGAVLSISEPCYYGGKAILGIHIAGKTNSLMSVGSREGYAAALTLEFIEKALDKFKPTPVVDRFHEDLEGRGIELEEVEDIETQCGVVGGSITYVGSLSAAHSISQAGKSKLMRTGFSGWGRCPVAPAPLRPVYRDGILIKPMHQAMANYKKPVQPSAVRNGAAIMGLAMKMHNLHTKHCTRKILTFEESVLGVPEMKIKNTNRSTSPGWPWRLECANGKRDIFGSGVEFDLYTEKAMALRGRVEEVLEAAKRGERLAHVFADFLKDETRPHAKVEQVMTRAISGAPLDYTIAVRMYFGAFLSSMFLHNTVSGMAPGLNYYSDWSTLARELLRKGEKMFAGDFKAFDASEQPDIHLLILDYINDWYDQYGADPEGRRVRTVLFEDLIHSRHLTGDSYKLDTIVQWNKSLPSGHPLTTAVNSMYSLFTLTACYVHLTKDHENMWDHVFICTFGDDNVVSADDDTIAVFNQVSVAKAMQELFHLTYTSDKKDAELVPYETIHDITFLKRSFVRSQSDGGWIAPLAMDSILYRTYFYQNPRNYVRDQATNFKEALMELSLHGEEEWDERFQAAAVYCRDNNIDFCITSREQARQMCLARTDVWF
ncbi:hypothetical protein 1 [Wenzhou picorna-like virus 33]|uniref:hypothetical protein 1 n=1 Tax=Wenzhou picorna-like virus 33 TaxID=1923619 RepID=UPI00090BC49D|nr:hypothetical protein 1 [Wenzhou picorna-like virus 33]APG78516.1 hypothetical protein 1 [Wenzhou picorna-like virus 33]